MYTLNIPTSISRPDDYQCKCVASACMMWRSNPIDSTDGYCGLAGFQNHVGGG